MLSYINNEAEKQIVKGDTVTLTSGVLRRFPYLSAHRGVTLDTIFEVEDVKEYPRLGGKRKYFYLRGLPEYSFDEYEIRPANLNQYSHFIGKEVTVTMRDDPNSSGFKVRVVSVGWKNRQAYLLIDNYGLRFSAVTGLPADNEPLLPRLVIKDLWAKLTDTEKNYALTEWYKNRPKERAKQYIEPKKVTKKVEPVGFYVLNSPPQGELQGGITKEWVLTAPTTLFLYEESVAGFGTNPAPSTVACRGEKNTLPIVLMKYIPYSEKSLGCFFSDTPELEFEMCKRHIDKSLQKVYLYLYSGNFDLVVMPSLGAEKSQLAERAPRLYGYFITQLFTLMDTFSKPFEIPVVEMFRDLPDKTN